MFGPNSMDYTAAYAAPGAGHVPEGTPIMEEYGVSGGVSVKAGGTAPRVAAIIVLAGAGLYGLRMLGFRFNVGVSS